MIVPPRSIPAPASRRRGSTDRFGSPRHRSRLGSVERTELQALRSSRPQAPAVQTGGTEENKPTVLTAALCLSAGVPEAWLGQQYDEPTMNAATSGRFQDVSLHYLMDEVIRATGRHYTGSRRSNDFIRAAFEGDRQIQAESGFTTFYCSTKRTRT